MCLPPPKLREKIFLGQMSSKIPAFLVKYHVHYGNFVTFSGKYHIKFGPVVNFRNVLIFTDKFFYVGLPIY